MKTVFTQFILIINLNFVYNYNVIRNCMRQNTIIHPQEIFCQSDFGKLMRYWDKYVQISLIENFKTITFDEFRPKSQFWFISLEKTSYPNLHIGLNYLISGIVDNSVLKVTNCSYFEYANQISYTERVLLTQSYVKSCSCKVKQCEHGVEDNSFRNLINRRYMNVKEIPYRNGLKADIVFYSTKGNKNKDSCCMFSDYLMTNYTCLPDWFDGSCVWTVNP